MKISFAKEILVLAKLFGYAGLYAEAISISCRWFRHRLEGVAVRPKNFRAFMKVSLQESGYVKETPWKLRQEMRQEMRQRHFTERVGKNPFTYKTVNSEHPMFRSNYENSI